MLLAVLQDELLGGAAQLSPQAVVDVVKLLVFQRQDRRQMGVFDEKANVPRAHFHDLLGAVPGVGLQQLELGIPPLEIYCFDDGSDEIVAVGKMLVGRSGGDPAGLGDAAHGEVRHAVLVDLVDPGLDQCFAGVAVLGLVSHVPFLLPGCRWRYGTRRVCLRIFPLMVLGRASTNFTCRTHL